jgi:hypothetical protein
MPIREVFRDFTIGTVSELALFALLTWLEAPLSGRAQIRRVPLARKWFPGYGKAGGSTGLVPAFRIQTIGS